jgi:hypothetical protein
MKTADIRVAYVLQAANTIILPNRMVSAWAAGSMTGVEGHQASRHRGAHEHHRQKQQPATQEDGCEEAILEGAETVPDYREEPKESDSGERHQHRGDGDAAATAAQPLHRPVGTFGHLGPNQDYHGGEQHAEDHSRDCRGPGCGQRADRGNRWAGMGLYRVRHGDMLPLRRRAMELSRMPRRTASQGK